MGLEKFRKNLFFRNKYLFSIIVPVYNSETYLDEAISSVINQSIGFKYIQLILVDDGSTDGSYEILLKYQKSYPNNILVLSQENQGPASARNLGLEHAKGEYISFLDSDDFLSENALYEVQLFFTENPEIKIVTIPQILFERYNGYNRLNHRFSFNRIVDLKKEPNNPLMSVSSVFIHSSLITPLVHFDSLNYSEDTLFINKLLLNESKYGLINKAKYYYRQRLTLNGIHDSVPFSKDYYSTRFEEFHEKLINTSIKDGIIPDFIQYVLLYDLRSFFLKPQLNTLLQSGFKVEIFKNVSNVLKNIDKNNIEKNKLLESDLKKLLLILKEQNFQDNYPELTQLIQKSSNFNEHINVDVSIIIPVYNVENYLEECLQSVINQSLDEIEIICVDDGSTDGSLNILNEYVKKDFRLRVISKENGGQAIARNIAINEAIGDYIGFVDSDDYIDKDMFKELYGNASVNDTEISMCKITTYDETNGVINENDWYYSLRCFEGFNKEVFNNIDTKEFTPEISVTPVNKLYKRSFLINNNLFFPENLIFEDEVFFYEIYLKAKRISIVNKNLYTYRINRSGSTVTTNKENDYTDIVRVFQNIREVLKKNNLLKIYKKSVYNRFFHSCLARYSQTSDKYRPRFWRKMKKDFVSIIDFKDSKIPDDVIHDYELELRVKNRVSAVCASRSFREFEFKDSQKIFTIVMAVYNTERYLDEAISSVIGQSIGFVHNVQLILVDDGSTDNSKEILSKYQDLYPDNVLVLSQENQGQASARNLGLRYANGEYINFLDSDDYFSYHTLKDVYEFFLKFGDKTDVVGIPIFQFGRINEPHILNSKFSQTRVIDLVKEPNNPQLSAASSFIRKEALNNIYFPTNFVGSEDGHFINKILLKKKTLGSVSTSRYYYRRRDDFSSTLDTMGVDFNHFTPRLKLHFMELINYSINKEGNIPKFIQNNIVYDLQWILSLSNNDVFENNLYLEEFLLYLKNILQYIDDNVILYNKNVQNSDIKRHIYCLKYGKEKEIASGNVVLKSNNIILDQLKVHKIWLDIVEINNNQIIISGLFNSLFDRDFISIIAKKRINGSIEIFSGNYIEYEIRKDKFYLPNTWQFNSNFDIRIPFNKKDKFDFNLSVCYHKDGDNLNHDSENLIEFDLPVDFNKFCSISNDVNYLLCDNTFILFENNSFKVSPYSIRTAKNVDKNILSKFYTHTSDNFGGNFRLIRLFLYLYPLIMFVKRFKHIYLFMDRVNMANDNSEVLFQYAINEKDSISKYFIIDENSDDYNRLKNKYVIGFNSLKHRFLYLVADKIIVSHPDQDVHNPFFKEYGMYASLISSKIYFIQHGVTQNNVSKWLKKFDKNISLISTVSDIEKESFINQGNGYDDSIINTLGFPRFDNLENTNIKKQILIMPSWLNLDLNETQLQSTKYFIKLNELLCSESLFKLCNDFDYEIVFKPHPNLLNYIHLFNIPDYIKLATDESYADLFNNSALLITDYSSVAFDFAYLKKPIIYYQYYDFVNFNRNLSYYKYESMGFGHIVNEYSELLDKIKFYLNNGCVMEERFINRVNDFFKYTDKNNCKRVYEWIRKH